LRDSEDLGQKNGVDGKGLASHGVSPGPVEDSDMSGRREKWH
jgi:hypothetical protein